MSPKHPLRRISTGSLSSLARSQERAHASLSGLDFLEPALTDLADEAAALTTNMQRTNEMSDALDKFNEGFAAYLYALKMNAFCVEWNEAPDANSWRRLQQLSAPEPVAEPLPKPRAAASRPSVAVPSSPSNTLAADTTYATVYSSSPPPQARGGSARPAPARGGLRRPAPSAAVRKAALSAKKRKEVEISKIIDSQLPLEYRGGDLDARVVMEQVIGKLMDAENGLGITSIVSSPTLPHPRVNKALIALVAKKLVAKSNEKGKTIYHWVGQ